jgi:hypothetical protein
MRETPQERINHHLALLVGNLQAMKERGERSSKALEGQRMFADSAVYVALTIVSELLPFELQSTVMQLVELRQVLWQRGVEIRQEGSHAQ